MASGVPASPTISYAEYVQLAWSSDLQNRSLIELSTSRVGRVSGAILAGGSAGAFAGSSLMGVGALPGAVIGAAVGCLGALSIYGIYDLFKERGWGTIGPKLRDIILANPDIVVSQNGTNVAMIMCPLTCLPCVYPVSIIISDAVTSHSPDVYEFQAIEEVRSRGLDIPYWYVIHNGGYNQGVSVQRLEEAGSRPNADVTRVIPNPTAYLLLYELCDLIVRNSTQFPQFTPTEIANIEFFRKHYYDQGLKIVDLTIEHLSRDPNGLEPQHVRNIIHYYTDLRMGFVAQRARIVPQPTHSSCQIF